jgi:CBS domain-containing protein
MIYISTVIDQKVWDIWGNSIGKCKDIVIGHDDRVFPLITAISVQKEDGSSILLKASQVSSLFPSITLKVPAEDIAIYEPVGNELYLRHQILDHQIVDVEGKRVVRVNDIQIAFSKDNYVVTGVDISNLGLLRRLGLEKTAMRVSRVVNRPLNKGVIAWKDVAYVQAKDPLRLNKSQEKISKLPPADIAMILNDLDRVTTQKLIEEMDNEVVADALEESPSKTQIEVLSSLESERAADILEEMDPDEAADLLADLPKETSAELLGLMESDEADDVRKLLHYPPDSAGGIMTTDYGWILNGLKVGEAIEFLRSSEDAQEVEDMYYIYVLDKKENLMGVIYLRDLVMASPQELVDTLMDHDPVYVEPMTPQDEVAYLIAKYNLLSIPVLKEGTRTMIGIVTLDDAIDSVLPTAYKKRLPRFF